LRRESDGSLFDLDERRRIELTELADDIRSGRYFRATRHSSGEDCTQEVIAETVLSALPTVSSAGSIESVMASVFSGMAQGAGQMLGGVARRDEPYEHTDRHDRHDRYDRREDRPDTRRRRRPALAPDRHDWWEGD
jgi:hypothetical protein